MTTASGPKYERQRRLMQRLAEHLWEQHGHPGQHCEIGSRGIGSCALAEARSGGVS